MATVNLISSDEMIFSVDMKAAKLSKTIGDMLDHIGVEEGKDECIPLPNVSGEILLLVMQWCEYHKNDPEKKDGDKSRENYTNGMKQFDQDFMRVDDKTLYKLILAANYLNISDLLDLTCKRLAGMLKGKTPEEMRRAHHIKNDFTPRQEKLIREENGWCVEDK